ncbi:MAG: hypothetical protein ABJE47_08840 [bacterium]
MARWIVFAICVLIGAPLGLIGLAGGIVVGAIVGQALPAREAGTDAAIGGHDAFSPSASSLQRLGRFYLLYGAAVGGCLYLLLLVGTQAARSTAEMFAGPALGLVVPLPMILVAVALMQEWRFAVWLAEGVAVLMAGCVFATWTAAEPTRATPVLRSFVFGLVSGQRYFLPGAVILAVLVGITAIRTSRARLR